MGGYGSTRWGSHSKRDTIEDCLVIDASQMMRDGTLKKCANIFGGWTWKNSYTGEQTAAVGYEVNTTEFYSSYSYLRLHYTQTRTQERLDYQIRLTTTRPNFGGLRWWFLCPLVVNGRLCNRRVSKLYSPPTARYFGCRQCYDLTYTSCQESDKRVNWLRKNPAALMALMDDVRSENVSTANLILALKALK